jgi:hypothetical protein
MDMHKISIQAARPGFMRFGRRWSLKPELAVVEDFKGDRPTPPKGAVVVISPTEYDKLQAYVVTKNAQLLIGTPDDAQLLLAEEEQKLSEMVRQQERLQAAIGTSRKELAALDEKLVERRAQRDALERSLADIEEKRIVATSEAEAAEARYKEHIEALEEARAQQGKRQGKRG